MIQLISINTKRRSPTEARKLMNDLETELNLPCVDPIREGAERLLEAVLLE